MKIRLATVSDNQALLKIYAQYIDTPITFECVPVSYTHLDVYKRQVSIWPTASPNSPQ